MVVANHQVSLIALAEARGMAGESPVPFLFLGIILLLQGFSF